MVTAAFGSAHILFLSTPSARRATWYNYINKSTRPIISIHALREEGDGFCFWMLEHRIQFLSTPSARRATVTSNLLTTIPELFLSTPSARRATTEPCQCKTG